MRTRASATVVVQRHARREMLHMCAKVTLVLGFNWTLLIISTATGVAWLNTLAEAVNGLQGLGVAVSFLSTGRVKRDIRSSISRSMSSRSNATVTTTTGGGTDRNSTSLDEYHRGARRGSSERREQQQRKRLLRQSINSHLPQESLPKDESGAAN